MIYCIVHDEAYHRLSKQYSSPLQKLAGQPGDYVFETQADAQAFIDRYKPGQGLAVYRLRADWKRDTAPTDLVGFHRLLVDAEIIPVDSHRSPVGVIADRNGRILAVRTGRREDLTGGGHAS